MYCDRCGSPNREEARFCAACGAPVASSPEPSTLEARPDDALAGVRRALAPAFDVERLLGRGGMGAVYLAREASLDRQVAIKVLGDASRDSERVARFLSEARLAAKLRHPNVVAIHAVGGTDSVPYMVMEYVAGPTLSDLVRTRGPLPAAEAAALLCGAARGVAHAHRNGVVHRDLKPGNVMVDSDGRVVVMDFGLAKALGAAGLSASGVVVGTPAYMSPEQLQGRPASPLSDIYALGLMYFFLLAGRSLIEGEDVSAVIAQHLTADLQARVAAEPRVPPSVRSLLASMVERRPDRRPVSLDVVLGKLGEPAPIASSSRPGTDESTSALPATPSPGTHEPSSDSVRRRAREKMKGLLEKLEPPRD